MCGIFVALSSRLNEEVSNNSFNKVFQRLIKRGPDSFNVVFPTEGLLMAHSRLAIRDTSSAGIQPMTSSSNKYVIAFNGEIYNTDALAALIPNFDAIKKSDSDTEVLLEYISANGIHSISDIRGMFSIVIYDVVENKLFVLRDSYGIKPLYYSMKNGVLLIGSTIKTIIEFYDYQLEPNNLCINSFRVRGRVNGPQTTDVRIMEFPRGCTTEICLSTMTHKVVTKYTIDSIANTSKPLQTSEPELYNLLDKVLFETISSHLISDVPIGILLSAGIDSALIAHYTENCNHATTKYLTIGFEEYVGSKLDEVPNAAKFASKLSLDHRVKFISKDEFYNDVPQIFDAMDQPSVDGINTWYACKFANEQGCRVVLSGVGADELFLGYNNFNLIQSAYNLTHKLPGLQCLLKVIDGLFGNFINSRHIKFILSSYSLEKMHDIKRALVYASTDNPELVDEYIRQLYSIINLTRSSITPIEKLVQYESMLYMSDQLLKDSDWASMSNSVELRTPFVDIELFKKVSCYINQLSRYGRKYFLKEIIRQNYPCIDVDRKKTGFNAPFSTWLIDYVWDFHNVRSATINQAVEFLYLKSFNEERIGIR